MLIVDSHCHLNYPEFTALDAVIQRANEAGVGVMQTISTKRSDFDAVHQIALDNSNIYCSIGVHPHEAETHQDVSVEELVAWANKPKVIALGETGLDYYYEHSPRKEQQTLFLRHIEASRQTGLPIIVHTRDADEDTIRILEEEYAKAPFKGLIHCFSSSEELALRMVEIGFYISISGIVTFNKAQELRDTVVKLPLERLLVETDAPYLAPMPHRGKPNEPAFTALVAQKVAQIKDVSVGEVARVTTDNFFTLFSKAERPA